MLVGVLEGKSLLFVRLPQRVFVFVFAFVWWWWWLCAGRESSTQPNAMHRHQKAKAAHRVPRRREGGGRSGVRITRGNEKRAAFFPVAPACRPAAHARARFRGRRGKGGEGRRSKQESGCSRFCFPTLYFCGSGKKTREGGEEEGGLSFERRRWGATMRASSCFVSALLLPCVCVYVYVRCYFLSLQKPSAWRALSRPELTPCRTSPAVSFIFAPIPLCAGRESSTQPNAMHRHQKPTRQASKAAHGVRRRGGGRAKWSEDHAWKRKESCLLPRRPSLSASSARARPLPGSTGERRRGATKQTGERVLAVLFSNTLFLW